MKQLKSGDKVRWNTPQGETAGRVVKKLTSPTKVNGHKAAASREQPEYLVRSGKSGKKAAHKPGTLKKM
ncbi:MAG: hypothetical protein A4E19_14135 [Nitrospira sp. SG-bin1]|nr:MAG: hypothetical protein A4E19_14135 [Nitrospira sp. SG-bin1]